MNDWQWKKRAELSKQLKFFKAKKQKFISCYAGKPRIRMSIEFKQSASSIAIKSSRNGQLQLAAIYQNQLNRGMQNSALGYQQMVYAQQSMAAAQAGSMIGAGGILGGRFI